MNYCWQAWWDRDYIKKLKRFINPEPADYIIIVTAADKENAKVSGVYKLTIRDR